MPFINSSVQERFSPMQPESTNNCSAEEIEKFTKLAESWWDPNGPLQTLHAVNPLRLQWILHKANLTEKAILDVGCGGGILTERLAHFSSQVIGIDQSENCIKAASAHALSNTDLSHQPQYLHTPIEALAADPSHSFDVITCMEMLEHVPDPIDIITNCAKLLKPKGFLFLSTLNRTSKAFLQAIIGAEYVLKMIPTGTHKLESFIKPSELVEAIRDRKLPLSLKGIKGITYNMQTKQFLLCNDVSVNYMMVWQKL